jgi:hypothetical protein
MFYGISQGRPAGRPCMPVFSFIVFDAFCGLRMTQIYYIESHHRMIG